MLVKRLFCLALAIFFTFSLTSCSRSDQEKNETLVIYDGQFAETRIIHRMVKLLVEKHTNAKVDIRNEMAPPSSFHELVKGSADIMNSYDGTVLTTFLHLDPSHVPAGMSLYDYTNQEASKRHGVHLLGKMGTNNTYAVAVPQDIAKKYNLETISDLARVAPKLVFAAEHDFFTEEGSAKFNPFIKFYRLNFKESKQIDMSLKYPAVLNGNVDVVIVYATDGLNKQANLKILKDDKHFFPEYNSALLVRDDVFTRFAEVAPNLEKVLDMLTGTLTDKIMVDLSYQVDIGENGKRKTAEDVAETFLKSLGLI